MLCIIYNRSRCLCLQRCPHRRRRRALGNLLIMCKLYKPANRFKWRRVSVDCRCKKAQSEKCTYNDDDNNGGAR